MCIVENRQIENPDRVVVTGLLKCRGSYTGGGFLRKLTVKETRVRRLYNQKTANVVERATWKDRQRTNPEQWPLRPGTVAYCLVNSLYSLNRSSEPLLSEIAAHRLWTTEECTTAGGIRVKTVGVSGMTAETMFEDSDAFVLDVMVKTVFFFLIHVYYSFSTANGTRFLDVPDRGRSVRIFVCRSGPGFKPGL